MKTILLTILGTLALALPTQAKTFRIGCGVGGAANPHNGSMYVAIYRNGDMPTYRMMIWKQGLISVEENIVIEESAMEPATGWPKLIATMKAEHAGSSHTFRITIDKPTRVTEHVNDHGNFDFEAEGYFEMSLAPGKKFALACDGVFNPN